MKIASSFGIYTTDVIMKFVYCYLKGNNDNVLKFHTNDFSYLGMSASLFQAPPSDKHCT